MLDQAVNFALGTLAAGIASGATAVTLTTGNGARFTQTRAFNVVIWNSTDYPIPDLDPSREIVRVTAGFGTDAFTIARAQENTTDVAHNTAGKTYSIAAVLTSKWLNTDFYGVPSLGISLPGAKVVSFALSGIVTATATDAYTVPAGKRAYVNAQVAHYNSAASGQSGSVGFVLGGTYYSVATFFGNANTGSSVDVRGIVLEAGEKIRCVTDSALNSAFFGSVVEFDAATSNVRSIWVTPAAGNNLLYTAPAGKTVAFFNQGGPWAFSGVQAATPTNQNYYPLVVPSGQSVGVAWRTSAAVFIGGARNSATALPIPGLNAGDSLYVNSDISGGLIWVTFLEL